MSTITGNTAPAIGQPLISSPQPTELSAKMDELTLQVTEILAKLNDGSNAATAKEANMVQAQNKPAEKAVSFKCPGHTEFFHRYTHREKAKRQASEEIASYEKRANIAKAVYKLISKNTPEGKNSVYFQGLNKIYRHAIDIIFYHTDGCVDCEFNPLFEAKK